MCVKNNDAPAYKYQPLGDKHFKSVTHVSKTDQWTASQLQLTDMHNH